MVRITLSVSQRDEFSYASRCGWSYASELRTLLTGHGNWQSLGYATFHVPLCCLIRMRDISESVGYSYPALTGSLACILHEAIQPVRRIHRNPLG